MSAVVNARARPRRGRCRRRSCRKTSTTGRDAAEVEAFRSEIDRDGPDWTGAPAGSSRRERYGRALFQAAEQRLGLVTGLGGRVVEIGVGSNQTGCQETTSPVSTVRLICLPKSPPRMGIDERTGIPDRVSSRWVSVSPPRTAVVVI